MEPIIFCFTKFVSVVILKFKQKTVCSCFSNVNFSVYKFCINVDILQEIIICFCIFSVVQMSDGIAAFILHSDNNTSRCLFFTRTCNIAKIRKYNWLFFDLCTYYYYYSKANLQKIKILFPAFFSFVHIICIY